MLNSYMGGYWVYPERSKSIKYESGMSIPVIIHWQPYQGYKSDYKTDIIGHIYSPLIQIGRRFVHKSKSLLDDNIEDWFENLDKDDIHPKHRSE